MWAEPCLLPTATSKLSGAVEQWLSAAERLYGPYLWGRYVLGLWEPWRLRGRGAEGAPPGSTGVQGLGASSDLGRKGCPPWGRPSQGPRLCCPRQV